MRFYTNVQMVGDNFLVRGYEDGKHFMTREKFYPTLFVPSNKKTKYQTLNGEYVESVQPGSVRDCREFVKKYDGVENFKIFGNTQYIYQYISEMYPEEELKFDISKIKVTTLDIEVASENGFPDVESAAEEVLLITIQDYSSKKIRTWGQGPFKNQQKNVEYRSFSNEYDLLNDFINWWMIEDNTPEVVTGWNSAEFDMPYLYRRMKNIIGNSKAKHLSPIGVAYINDWNKKLVIAGVTHIDYMELYKKLNIKQEASYALNAIGKKVVGMEKITYKGSLDDLYKSDINKYIEYNLNDVKIIVALEKKLQFIEQARAICHKGHVPYDCFTMSSRFIEGAILMYLRRKGQVAKNKPIEGREEYEQRLDENEEGFEGAYVKSPVPGRYDWVFDLDLTSMYPNIIISLNISPETKVAVIHLS